MYAIFFPTILHHILFFQSPKSRGLFICFFAYKLDHVSAITAVDSKGSLDDILTKKIRLDHLILLGGNELSSEAQASPNSAQSFGSQKKHYVGTSVNKNASVEATVSFLLIVIGCSSNLPLYLYLSLEPVIVVTVALSRE